MGSRAATQRHHMGISITLSKQLRAPSSVSRARWVNVDYETRQADPESPHKFLEILGKVFT